MKRNITNNIIAINSDPCGKIVSNHKDCTTQKNHIKITVQTIFIFCCLQFIFSNYMFSQNVQTYCTDATFNTSQTTPKTHLSRTKITLDNGFVADGANGTFVFGADEHVICTIDTANIVATQPTYNHNTNLPVGAIAGVADVSPSGAATYTIPLFVSPGINGMEPQITLNYNSQTGNGILGLGWSLSGLSAISLSPNLAYNDGYFEAIKFDTDGTAKDRYVECYALDGNRLVEISSNNFRTEIESFQKIEKLGSGVNISFKVTNKNGITTFYGGSSNSRIMLNNNKVLSWLIDKIEDQNGNYIVYEYQEEDGERLIRSIKYTGNQTASIEPFNNIEFYYGERTDKSHSYISGTKFNQTVLLEKIRIFSEEELVKEYFLKYLVESNKVSRLVKIEENSENEILNSTIFEWGNDGVTFLEQAVSTPFTFTDNISTYSGPAIDYFTGDFNGDGHADIVVCYKFTYDKGNEKRTYFATYINNGNGVFSYYSQFAPSNGMFDLYLGDYDYDGADELTIVGQDYATAYRGNWNTNTNSWDFALRDNYINGVNAGNIRKMYYAGNFNAKGKSEEFMFQKIKQSSNNIQAIFRVRDANDDVYWDNCGSGDNIPCDYSYTGARYAYTPVPLDFDGDGVLDFIDIFNYKFSVYEFWHNKPTNVLDLHTISFIPNTVLDFNNIKDYKVGDFNGDGKSDLLVRKNIVTLGNTWKIYFSDGLNFNYVKDFASTYNTGVDRLYVCDMNGDGKADIVETHGTSQQHIIVKLSDGLGNFTQVIDSISSYNSIGSISPLSFADFNNDGIMDIVMGTYQPRIIYFNKNSKSSLITSITDGYTQKTQFEYQSLNKNSTQKAAKSGEIYPLYNNMQVCSKITQKTGLTTSGNDIISTIYTYNKGKIHVGGKGFLGFEEIIAKNATLNTQTKTTNTLNTTYYAISNNTVETRTYDWATIISKQENTMHIRKMSTNNNYIAIVPKTVINRDYLTHNDNYTSVTYNYTNESHNSGDFYGNLSTQVTSLSGIYTTTVTYTNYVNNGSWCVSRPQNITETTAKTSFTNVGTQTAITYDNKGRITKSVSNAYPTPTTDDKPLTTTYTYDNFGNVLTTSIAGKYNDNNSHTRTSSVVYEYKGRFLVKSTGIAGLITEYQYDPKFGNKTWEKDPLGNITTYEYDSFGVLKKVTTPLATTTITRAWESSVTANKAYSITSATTGKPTTKTWYDILGREVQTQTNLYNKISYTKTEYNKDGTLKQESLPYFTTATNWKTYSYDAVKRCTTSAALNLTTSIAYSNGQITTTTPDGITETKTLNKLGEITDISGTNGSISYTYNAFGKPKTITAEGTVTTMEYDVYGNQTKLIDANAGTTTYKYNAFGELTYQKDANNNEFTLIYNNKGQLTNKNCNNTQFSTTYTYITSGTQNGLLQKEALGNGHEKNYTYNNLGAVTQLDEKIDGTVYSHKYTYDSYGNVKTYTYPSGYKITNEYDTYGYKTGVREGSTYIWQLTGSNYINEMGQLKEYKLGNNLTSTRGYDPYFELSNIQTKNATNTPIFNHSYSFNHTTGNLTYRKDETCNKKESFSYDSKQRLTGWSNTIGVPLLVNYDNNGNITSKDGLGNYDYSQTTKPHAVDNIDNNNVISPYEQNITYNPFQKTETISQQNGKNRYSYTITYGTDTQRKKTVYAQNNVTLQTKIYSGLYENITANNVTTELHYIPTPCGTVAVHITQGNTENTYFLLKDYLGSTLKVIDNQGNMIEEHSYDAWGNHRHPSAWVLVTFNSLLGIRGYTGHEMLPQFQLIDMNGRMYDPVIGRMLAPDNYIADPSNAQDYNRYSYARNNPLKYTDPDGEFVALAMFIAGFCADFFTNFANGVDNPAKTAYNNVNHLMNGMSTSAQIPIIQKGNFSLTAGLDPFALGVSANMYYSPGNFNFSSSGGYGLLCKGFWNFGASYTYKDFTIGDWKGDFIIGGSIGGGKGYWGWNAKTTWGGYGVGYGRTYYENNVSRYDGQAHRQTTAELAFFSPNTSFRLSNDVWGDNGDRWKTSAMEVSFGNFVMGTNLYTNDPNGNAVDESYRSKFWSKIWQKTGLGAYKNSKVYSSPFYIGLRVGNSISRIGIDHPLIQDITQNGIHILKDSPLFMTPYGEYARPYFYSGYYNPYSLY